MPKRELSEADEMNVKKCEGCISEVNFVFGPGLSAAGVYITGWAKPF
jgi:hypothetical protein